MLLGLCKKVRVVWETLLQKDCQIHIIYGFGLEWQFKKIGLRNSLNISLYIIGIYIIWDFKTKQFST